MDETELSEEEIKAARNVIRNTPAGALPNSGMGFGRNPETVGHLIEIMDSMAAVLRQTLRSEQELRDEKYKRERQMAVAGGLLRELLAAGLATDVEAEG